MADPRPAHTPVLPEQVVACFSTDGSRTVVDCTVGLGGHAELLLEACPDLRIIGLDVDDENLAAAARRLEAHADRVKLVHASFAGLEQVLAEGDHGPVAGILADLGVSSNQISDARRGLSFDIDGPLDMRLDRRLKTTAADLVNGLSEGELSDLLYFQSQERHSRRIAKRICQVRRQGRISSTVQLARIVASAVGEHPDSHRRRIHPATRTFMALRMSINQEPAALRELLRIAPAILAEGGRIAVISFHSVEDRIVKDDFRARSREGIYRILTKKPMVANDAERAANPRSRSAKLRIAERRATR
ncbi:MAG: 16S rRNA (cytosine(1402)-N(4))-methyltransferase RsmH [Phycisphaerae bacterium]